MTDETSMTVAMLEAEQLRLAAACPECGRFKYLRLQRYGLDESVGEIGARLTCGRCLSPAATAVVVRRDARNGFWPAEQG